MEEKPKRPTWDEYFLGIVKKVGERSTCDRGRSGAVIVKDNRILTTGYIGAPAGLPHCDDVGHQMKTVDHGNGKVSRHCVRTLHAEQNALIQAAKHGISVNGATMYCNMTPCSVCAMLIINAGIKKVISRTDYHAGEEAKQLFKDAGIEFTIVEGGMQDYEDQ